MLSLILALLIIAVSVYAIVDYKRLMPAVDRFYKQFGSGEKLMKGVSTILFLGVLLASLYIALQWVRHPAEDAPTFGEVGRIFLSDTERYSDQAGEFVESGVEDVGSWFSGKKTAKVKELPGAIEKLTGPEKAIAQFGGAPAQAYNDPFGTAHHMDFNAGLGQQITNIAQWRDLYEPKLVTGDGTCHPTLKGTCSGLLASPQDLSTCSQVTVSPVMNLDSSIHAWTTV